MDSVRLRLSLRYTKGSVWGSATCFGTFTKVRSIGATRFIVASLSFVCTKNVTTLYRHVRKGIPTCNVFYYALPHATCVGHTQPPPGGCTERVTRRYFVCVLCVVGVSLRTDNRTTYFIDCVLFPYTRTLTTRVFPTTPPTSYIWPPLLVYKLTPFDRGNVFISLIHYST